MRGILVLTVLLHAYIGLRLLWPFPPPIQALGALALALCFVMLPKGWRPPPGTSQWAVLVPWITLGFFSWLLVLTVVRDVALLPTAFLLAPATLHAWERGSAAFVMAATPLITAAGYFMARRVAPVTRVRIPIAGLPPALEGFAIAQVSDVHVGPTIKRDFVEAIVERVNRLEADLVAITGDLVDGSVQELASHVEPLARLQSRHGTYAILGNHEYYSGAQAWIRELRRLGAHVLLNEHVVIEHGGARLAVAGVTDYMAHRFDPRQRSDPEGAIAGAPEDAVRILLAHQPRSARLAALAGYQLQLSGHTHGGQFWPWNHFVRFQQPWTAGLQRLGSLWIYINRGTGYWGPPMRFGIPSEITLITLARAGA